jgi:clorobiocin biosynthesis protein CloN6
MDRDASTGVRAALPSVRADLLLLHAPAFFDFRQRGDIYFPYLSTSGDVPITPLYEYFPLGFKSLERHLTAAGHQVRIANLSVLFLKHPQLDADMVLGALDARVLGIDLHWMVHVQGCLEIARRLKAIHPHTPVLLGGISATYYAQELIRYPFVDMVMRGYDTHEPMRVLLDELASGGDLRTVPNLLWKDASGEVVDNGMAHLPDSLSCGLDWSSAGSGARGRGLPILELMTTQNAGCAYNCGWCGGSRDAFRRINGKKRAMSRKSLDDVALELASMNALPERHRYHLYSVGSYNEPAERMGFFLDRLAETELKSVSYEQFHLTPDDVLDQMVRANARTTITLSPESHDMRIAQLAGRGVYTPAEMEAWIERALYRGIQQIDIWYFVGMPEQDERSVAATVEYCAHLLRRFANKRVVPLICPMIPFLDPASTFFEEPERHGYRVFFRTAEDHRRGMTRASLINRINYETRWLRREDLVRVGYGAVRRLTELKAEHGMYPRSLADKVTQRIDDALELIGLVHAIDNIPKEGERLRELGRIEHEIRRRNADVLFGGVANQAFPMNRAIGGRWFDETLWRPEELAAATLR